MHKQAVMLRNTALLGAVVLAMLLPAAVATRAPQKLLLGTNAPAAPKGTLQQRTAMIGCASDPYCPMGPDDEGCFVDSPRCQVPYCSGCVPCCMASPEPLAAPPPPLQGTRPVSEALKTGPLPPVLPNQPAP